ncbi:hypothetical protein AB7W30_23050, partial [Providencia manganoxydans]|uniref:hypothetical protein n=1 Tax=Providencia manganoxydans TaxID=2923283 RepID=UPI0034E525F5
VHSLLQIRLRQSNLSNVRGACHVLIKYQPTTITQMHHLIDSDLLGLKGKDKQANCGNNVPENEIPALPPNHAAVSNEYSAYLIRVSINGLEISRIARSKESQPNQK